MGTVGVREFAQRASRIFDEIAKTGQPRLVTRRGQPVAYVIPVDADAWDDFVLANAPEFLKGMEAAEAEHDAGETVSLSDFRARL